MKLVKSTIKNYKSVEDSAPLRVGQMTCLVGKNEAGKTALLQALYKLNPVDDEKSKFDLIQEFPRRRLSDYEDEQKVNKSPAIVVETEWQITAQEKVNIGKRLGDKVLTGETVVIVKGYENTPYWTIPIDEKALASKLVADSGLTKEEKAAVKNASSLAMLFEHLEATQIPTETTKDFLAELAKTFPKKRVLEALLQDLMLPKFVYFANYHKLPGQVSVEKLQERKANNTLSFEDRVFLSLLDLAGAKLEEFTASGRFEHFVAKLEAISNRISREIFEYWSQNKHLRVDFRLDPARPQDPAPFNAGHVFRTRIHNSLHSVTVPFDERSTGFVWFFSFLIWFSQIKKTYGDNLIILLDEPGLTLHIKAQQDLLRYFADKLCPHHQVIYTTHSPFMIDAGNLETTRIVEDRTTDDEPIGTKVSERFLGTDKDSLFPLQAALGYDITQTLFIGKNTLLVEGPSDILYLKWISMRLLDAKRTHLDPSWVICPTGGIDKIATFISLFKGNQLNLAVLTDFHAGDKKKVRDLKETDVLREGRTYSAEEFAGQAEADIEDILGRDLYVALVNECYGLNKSNQLPSTKPAGVPALVVAEVEAHFRLLTGVPEFDHFRPALYLIENSEKLKKSLPGLKEAMDRFEPFFQAVNKLGLKAIGV